MSEMNAAALGLCAYCDEPAIEHLEQLRATPSQAKPPALRLCVGHRQEYIRIGYVDSPRKR